MAFCAAHFAPAPYGSDNALHTSCQLAGVDALVDPGSADAAGVAAKRDKAIDRLLLLAYSAHQEDEVRLLPAPLRGAKSAAAFLQSKSKKGGAPPSYARQGATEPIPGQPADLHLAHGLGVLGHVGRAMAQASAASAAGASNNDGVLGQVRAKIAAATASAPVAAAPDAKPLALDASTRKRFQGVLDALQLPLEVQLDVALTYQGDSPSLSRALPAWEEYAAALGAHATAAGADEQAASHIHCTQAAKALKLELGEAAGALGAAFAALVE